MHALAGLHATHPINETPPPCYVSTPTVTGINLGTSADDVEVKFLPADPSLILDASGLPTKLVVATPFFGSPGDRDVEVKSATYGTTVASAIFATDDNLCLVTGITPSAVASPSCSGGSVCWVVIGGGINERAM